jgi:predicted DNA-binding transcriptional regulator YafY
MPINRLFEIVYVLLGKKQVTAKELSGQFGVSQRTIYRDIDTLSLAGIPVYAEKGKGGGIRLLPEFVLNKSLLSEKEQQEILSALQVFSGVKASDTSQVQQKLSAIFNKRTVNWLQVDFSSWGSDDDGFFNDFKTAILEQRIAEFDYFSSLGEKTHRYIEPVQLMFKSKAWYVNGFCLKRNEMRMFRLTRVKNLSITRKHFSERGLSTAENGTGSSEHQKQYIHLKFKIKPEMAYVVYDDFNEKMVQKQSDGSFIVSAAMPADDWVIRFILSFGDSIEVLEPPQLRTVIKRKAEKIYKKYL